MDGQLAIDRQRLRKPVELPGPHLEAQRSVTQADRPSWWQSDAGLTEAVPTPWTPVAVHGSSVSVWGRNYHFTDSGLPQAIDSDSTPLLAGPGAGRLGDVAPVDPEVALLEALDAAHGRVATGGADGTVRVCNAAFDTLAPDGRAVTIYTKALTDQRYQATVGDEAQLTIIPGRLDVALAGLFGWRRDHDNTIAATEDNEIFCSAVLRAQAYLTPTFHFLGETSLAREHSLQGNLWRAHYSSIFTSTKGLANSDRLEFGDLDTRDTWQLKAGFVLNPTGTGIFTRPSLRLLYGLQWSNMHNAFGSGFVQTLDQFNVFAEQADRRWHQVISLEAETWF